MTEFFFFFQCIQLQKLMKAYKIMVIFYFYLPHNMDNKLFEFLIQMRPHTLSLSEYCKFGNFPVTSILRFFFSNYKVSFLIHE